MFFKKYKHNSYISLILVMLLLFSLVIVPARVVSIVSAVDSEQVFTDVPDEHWASDYINRLASEPLNIILGKGDGTFGLNLNTTRAEFATFMDRALNVDIDIPYQGTFSDVAEDKWYSQYVEAAFNANIIKGKGDGKFEPEANITRQEVTVVIANIIAIIEDSTVAKLAEDYNLSVEDGDLVSSWALDGLKVCYKFGITNGYDDRTFKPLNLITRAEVAKVISVYIDYSEAKITPTPTPTQTQTATAIPTETGTPTPVPEPALKPELPRVFLDTTYSEPTGDIIAVNQGEDLQAAINAAKPGDIIELEAGAEFIGNYILPNKTGDDWIHIRSSEYLSLPQPEKRVSIADSINMPKIVTPNGNPAISTVNYAHNYRLIGLEVETKNDNTTDKVYSLIQIGEPYAAQNTLEVVPHDFIIDRCYIHGTTTGNLIRGVSLQSARSSVIDSYISECHDIINDSQAICGWNGPGPFKIVNNFLDGAGENIMFGGGAASIPNMDASDIEIRGNYLYKPQSWNKDDPSYTGIPWCVKNIFELKNGKRVLFEGNILENNWIGADQSGYAIMLTPKNNADSPWITVSDILIRNNIIKNSNRAIMIMGENYKFKSKLSERIEISNNVFENINPKGIAQAIDLNYGGSDIVFDHNNIFQTNAILHVSKYITRFAFTNNITHNKGYGIGSVSLSGNSLMENYFPDCMFAKNIIAGMKPTTFSNYPDNFYNPPATLEDVGFVDYAGGDYRLSAISPYKNAGTDGKDIGADIDAIELATQKVITGK